MYVTVKVNSTLQIYSRIRVALKAAFKQRTSHSQHLTSSTTQDLKKKQPYSLKTISKLEENIL